MHFAAYLRSALTILQAYDGALPFAVWLKDHFRQHKKYGSKDRRWIGDLCFCFFRLGTSFADREPKEQLLIGQLLCHTQNDLLVALRPEWNAALPLPEKLRLLGLENAPAFFPFPDEVSGSVDHAAFNRLHLLQPDLFLRTRPGRQGDVVQKLTAAAVPFATEGNGVRLPANTKLDGLLALDEEAVVQDKSSQQVLDGLQEVWQRKAFAAWDCCAASGGKSILLHDLFPQAQLTVSDVRESILHNLRNRFKRAGIHRYRSFVADVSSPRFSLAQRFDVIVCDAPCSGSGTWGRTPERLRFFERERIAHYASLQKGIAVNAARCLQKGGAFVYVTCSVFWAENEEVVQHILQHTNLRLVDQRYFKGYEEKADTLFAATFLAQ